MEKICCVFSTPSLYRESIYKKIDQSYDCDWYFGDNEGNVKQFDINILSNHHLLHVVKLGRRIYWTQGLLNLLKHKNYNTYFMYGATLDFSMWLFLFLKILFFRKKKINIWSHGWYGKERWYEKVLKKLMYNIVDGVFTYGDYARKLLLDMGYCENKVFAIHNSLNYDKQLELRRVQSHTGIYQKHFGNDHPTIIFLGRLTMVKRLDMIIDAVAILKNEGHIYNVVIVGDGSEREKLEKKVEGFKLGDQIWFYGSCYDEKINAELVYNADLCVAPGNVGLTAMHTMMFGCPVITHGDYPYQMPEFEAIKPYRTGCFFERESVSSLAKKIDEWFRIKVSLREEVRQACYDEIDTNWNPYYQMDIIKKNLKMYKN